MKKLGQILLLIMTLPISVGALANDFPKGQPPVYVFTQDYCPACLGAEKYMKAHGIKYNEFNIDHNKKAAQVFQKLGARGVPFFVIGHKKETGFSRYVFQSKFNKAKSNMRSSD